MVRNDKSFKNIEELYKYEVGSNKFILISKVTRFNDERVVYINAKKFYQDEWHPTKGVRIPTHQIKNVIDTLEVLKKEHEEGNDLNFINEKFKNKHRFSVGSNSDLVINILKDKITRKDRIFIHYQPELGSTWYNEATDSKGVTTPLELIPEIIDGLINAKKKL